ncbi:DUF58 domain-containing protein [Candidatus Bipolaricaulota bacterium]|nr:DUF58 domain-containing protein [Candidatus Bipolaricaulota bacterium]
MPRFIDEAFLQRLAKLRFIVKGRRHGRLSGVHASPRSGVSLEFSDYRAYSPGDDFRYIDWNVYGRLDRVLVKTFVHEADLPIYLLVDFSASMQVGTPSKAQYSAQFAAGMAYLGLKETDRVGVYPFNDRLIQGLPPRHGMGQMGKIVRLLREAEPGGRTSIDQAITDFLAQTRESGIVFIISDFLGSDEFEEGLAKLVYRGDEVTAIQVLDPADVSPPMLGTTRIVDVESSQRLTLTIGHRTKEEYERRFREFQTRLKAFMLSRRINHFQVTTDRSMEQFIHEDLRRGGVLR